jgi:hypothetical protein
VFVALGSHHTMRMHHMIICGLLRSRIFSPYLKKDKIFENKTYLTQNIFRGSIQILSETFFIIIKIERDMTKIFIGLHLKILISFSILIRIEISRWIFEKF